MEGLFVREARLGPGARMGVGVSVALDDEAVADFFDQWPRSSRISASGSAAPRMAARRSFAIKEAIADAARGLGSTLTDPEGLASALDRLLETALSTPGLHDHQPSIAQEEHKMANNYLEFSEVVPHGRSGPVSTRRRLGILQLR